MLLIEMITMPKAENFHIPSTDRAEAWPLQAGFNTDQMKLQRLAREVMEISSLYNVAVAAGSSLNLEEIVQAIYKESGRLIDTTNFAIAICEAQSDSLFFALVFDRGQRARQLSIKRSACQNLVTNVLDTQSPLLIKDLLKADTLVELGQPNPNNQLRSWLGVPIVNPVRPDEGVQGVLATWSYEPNVFTDRELSLLSAVGTQAAIAIRNARLYEKVLAERDRAIEAEEKARKALARDLHDGPTQLVSAVRMHLDFCKLLLENKPAQLAEELTITQELAQQAVDDIRTMLFELRPLALEMEGLTAAVRVFLDRRQKDVGDATKLTLEISGLNQSGKISRQEERVETGLFAIVQESINNTIKHAQAENIRVKLGETSTEIYAIITDDGSGFDVDDATQKARLRGSLGMINLRERAELIGGELRLHSELGWGTRVAVRVPKASEERKKRRGATRPLSPSLDAEPRG